MTHKSERKRTRATELPFTPIVEESKSVPSTVLKGDEIQALSIRTEDLDQFHLPRRSCDQKTLVSNTFLVRKKQPQESRKKAQFLVAYPAASDIAVKNLDYSGTDGLQFDAYGQILPHSILGSLQELKREALARGNTQMAGLVTDSPLPEQLLLTVGKQEREKDTAERAKTPYVPPMQHKALENWKHHATLRKQQLRILSRHLQVPTKLLLMSLSDSYRQVQEQRYIIDRTLPAIDYGKGYRVGSEFWKQAESIGDEMSGLISTVAQCERGYPAPLTHVGKPSSILKETSESFISPMRKCRRRWDDSVYLLQRRHELKEILKELNFTQPDIDGLEVIGKGRPFTSVTVENFILPEEEKQTSPEGKENTDPLWQYPDVVSEIIFGPSLQFCGKSARWVGTTSSHRDEVAICARITFEVLALERALSVLEVINDGTAAIWYEWRRVPHISTLEEIPKYPQIQRFYFNTSAGVVLPGESIHFSFLFKSPNAGIFSEVWQFCTHPVLLGGASLQVSLWGIAVCEDKTYEFRQALETELEDRQMMALVKALVQELLDRVHTPELPQSPVDAYITEEELFHRKNPKLHYQHHVVKEIHQLWSQYIDRPPLEEDKDPQRVEAKEEWSTTYWNLSLHDFQQAALSLPEEEICEGLLFQLNKGILEMGIPSEKTHTELLYQICLQLWREAIDGMVSCSIMLRSVMGLPEKDFAMEGTVDLKRGIKGKKEDKKSSLVTEDKKGPGGKEKEEKKGAAKLALKDKAAEKEERPGSKKRKKSMKVQNMIKSLNSSMESLDVEPSDTHFDPIMQEKYQESLYIEVYELLEALVEHFLFFSEELKSKTLQEKEEEEYRLLV